MRSDAVRPRRVAHLDMDAFYASVELLRRPELKDRPVAIGGSGEPRSRGVITTATYAARAFGVRSGMPMRQAARLCPELIFLPVDFTEYRRVSARFKAALAQVEPRIENRGIDEVYLDLEGRVEDSEVLGRAMKEAVRDATALSCSVAIAPNKLLAKIGSDLDKPDGLTILLAEDLQTRIWPLPVGRINGIGPRANEKLESLGIRSIGDLARQRPSWLQRHFGANHAAWMLRAAHGIDDRPVVISSEHKSSARETTLEKDLHPQRDRARIDELLASLATRLAEDLRRHAVVARTIGIKLRFNDFRTVTRELSLSRPVCSAADLVEASRQCLARTPLTRPVRLIGVRAGALDGIEGADDDARAEGRDRLADGHAGAPTDGHAVGPTSMPGPEGAGSAADGQRSANGALRGVQGELF